MIRGYLDSCKEIVTCARTIANDIAATIPELQILGSPPGPVVAFSSRSEDLNILEVGDIMSKRGWHLNALSQPAALHIACTVSPRYIIVEYQWIVADEVAVALDCECGGHVPCRSEGLGKGGEGSTIGQRYHGHSIRYVSHFVKYSTCCETHLVIDRIGQLQRSGTRDGRTCGYHVHRYSVQGVDLGSPSWFSHFADLCERRIVLMTFWA